jgi:hypothetical protein
MQRLGKKRVYECRGGVYVPKICLDLSEEERWRLECYGIETSYQVLLLVVRGCMALYTGTLLQSVPLGVNMQRTFFLHAWDFVALNDSH